MGTFGNKFIITFLLLLTHFSFAQTIEECEKIIVEGVNAMNEKNHAKSIELLTQAKHVAQGHQWYRQMFLAYNNIGANYYMLSTGILMAALTYNLKKYLKFVRKKPQIIALSMNISKGMFGYMRYQTTRPQILQY